MASGKNCVAAASNDSAPALIVLDAEIELYGPDGVRRLGASDFYVADGIVNTVKRPEEIVARVLVPRRAAKQTRFEKLRRREAIDFPQLNTAVRLEVTDGKVSDVDLVVSTLAARPKRIKSVQKAIGEAPSEALFDRLADLAFKQCHPLTNLDTDPEWRRDMV
ncbi:MAG: FAD binding domain-containing protein, partial [Myxococcales bacterium]|nr:FAD binding domain-containing protein [Myxococcales bacterium]